ncbi:MAG: OpgC domain-containing protein [Sphingomonas fennica]
MRPERDSAIDMVRGLALLTITINHLTGIAARGGMRGMPFPTLSHYGFSSAAEIFFLLSGYLVGLVYLRPERLGQRGRFARAMAARAGKLYLFNLGLFLLLIPLCLASPGLARITFFHHFFAHGAPAFAGFLALYIQPFCLEILAAYIALLLLAPAFAWALVRRPWAAAALSVAVWAVSYYHIDWRLPGGTPAGDWKWNFSPGSWQLLFFGAMAAGRVRLLDRVRAACAGDARWFALAAAALAGLTLLFFAQDWLGVTFYGQSKDRLGLLRVGHALVVCGFGLTAFWTWPRLQRGRLACLIAAVGSASLHCFVASVAISYLAGLLWVESGRGYATYLLLSAAAPIALLAFGRARQALVASRAAPLPREVGRRVHGTA